MLVFLFTDIEGSSKLWETYTEVMTGIIARHDEILRELVGGHGGRITKHTGDGITAVFEAGQPLGCALEAQVRFAAEPWTEIGALPIRAGLHAGEAEFHASAGTPEGDYFGPPVNATARVMSAAWGGQILLTPEVTEASVMPEQAALLDLGQHLLKNVSAPQQLYQLLHPNLARQEFPPPRTLSGQSIRQAVGERGGQMAGLEPQGMGIALLSATLLPALQGELDPESGALEGNLGVLEELGAVSLRGFVAGFAERLQRGDDLSPREIQPLLQRELLDQWQAGGEVAVALRTDASRLLRAVHGVEAAMAAATDEVKEALARGLADLGSQFGEFGWMLARVQETLAEVRARQALQLALQREQLDLQRQQLVKTNLILQRQPLGVAMPSVEALPEVVAADLAPADLPCPYMGLAAFEAEDAEYFFGREELVAELTARLAGTRFLAVVGPSGSGKSSLVRAGLLPAVWAGALPGSEEWQTLVLTPGARPQKELAVRISLLKGISPGSLLNDLRSDPAALDLAVQQALADESDQVQLLLVVDQFEEIFALCRDEEERRGFIQALLGAVEADDSRTVIVPTIRADFYGRCAEYPRLAARMSDGLLVGPMSEEELRAAVERPAAVVGLRLEPGLADTILDDVAGEPGALPLLSHALLETFARRRGAELTLSGYAASGGVAGAIAQTADTVCAGLTAEEQSIARGIFLRLTELGEEGAQDTRRRVAPAELVRTPDEARPVERVLKTLADARLITTAEDTVEVAHEALIREWPELRGWLEEDREGLRIHRHLTEAAQDWERLEKDAGELYRGARLAAAGEWAEAHGQALNPLEWEFLAASQELARRREAEREARRQRELEAAQKLAAEQEKRAEEQARAAGRLRRRALLLAGAMVVAVILAVLAFLAFRQAEQSASAAQAQAEARATQQAVAETEAEARATQQAVAEHKAREALEAYSLGLAAHARQALAAKDPVTALALALAAADMEQPPALVEQTLMEVAFAGGPQARLDVGETFGSGMYAPCAALGPDGQTALIGTDTGDLILFDTETREVVHRLEGHGDHVQALAFSPDGTKALSSASLPPGVVILWDLTTGQELRRFRGHTHAMAVAFSPDSQMAVTAGFRGTGHRHTTEPGELILWDTMTGQEIRRCTGGHRNLVVDAAFSPDGQAILASSGVSDIMIHSASDSDKLFAGSIETLRSYGEVEHDLILWDAASCEVIHRFDTEGHDNASLAIGPQGEWALTRSTDHGIFLWDLRTGEASGRLAGYRYPVADLALSADGRTALFGGAYGHQLLLWDVERGEPLNHLNADAFQIWERMGMVVDISHDGRRGLSSSFDDTLVLWDLADLRQAQRLRGHVDTVADLAFTADGQYLVSSSGRSDWESGISTDNTIRLWDVAAGEPVRVLSGHADGVTSLSVGPDGKRLLSGSMDESVRLWDLQTGEELRRLQGHGSYVTNVALEPAGRTGLSGSAWGDILMWDLERGEFTQTLGVPGQVFALALSPDGRLALSGGSAENPIYIWDLEKGYFTGLFREHQGADLQIAALAISPDGRYALSGDSSGTILLWEIASGEVVHQLSGHSESVVDLSFGPDGLRAFTCDQGGTSILWDLESGAALGRFSAPGSGRTEACTLSPDGKLGAVGAGNDIVIWRMEVLTLDEMLEWIEENRYVRELSCQERELYRIEPLCEE